MKFNQILLQTTLIFVHLSFGIPSDYLLDAQHDYDLQYDDNDHQEQGKSQSLHNYKKIYKPQDEIEEQELSLGYFKMSGTKLVGSTYEDADAFVFGEEKHFLKRDDSSVKVSGGNNVGESSGAAEFKLTNQNTFYAVGVYVGSNKDKVVALLDTGSADFWVMNKNNTYCESNAYFLKGTEDDRLGSATDVGKFTSKEGQNKDTDDDILNMIEGSTITATATSTNTETQNNDYTPTSISISYNPQATIDCSMYGTFDPNESTSFQSNGTDFQILYADGTSANGTWVHDDLYINNIKINDVSFGLADKATSEMAVLGVGYPSQESTDSKGLHYENLPMKMKSDGLIKKITYSIYLNDSNTGSASLLFGGVDHERYIGDLALMPIVSSGGHQPTEIAITINSLGVGHFEDQHEVLVAEGCTTALLDTGTTMGIFPEDVLNQAALQLNMTYGSEIGFYLLDCDKGNETYFYFNFQGFNVTVPVSSFLAPISTDYDGATSSKCMFAVESSSDHTFVLGDVFLSNVYFVVDLEDNQIAMGLANLNSTRENIEVISDTIPSASSVSLYDSTYGGDGVSTNLKVVHKPVTVSAGEVTTASYPHNVASITFGLMASTATITGELPGGGGGSGSTAVETTTHSDETTDGNHGHESNDGGLVLLSNVNSFFFLMVTLLFSLII
ncbi:unnamed protein product [Ambrosiozyma monospora]|uniref:candidapepsin n=1 Tax=Ambrosiozyma monospora TaxID=43982 RepID=A0A9W6YQR5_AMBMO|nr:unnamed protein product [Ambrosiozyma monospora]